MLSLLGIAVFAVADDSPQQKYITKFAPLAVQEMYRSGVPASITLAQGLLESRSGLSALAAQGHNHFGIKCHNDWKGKSMKVDDDRKDECFRVYENDLDSFHDHSDFLRYRDRYKFLFDYDISDYKAWAYGLSKAGYATDKAYPAKLIKLIEDYDLSRYDKAQPSDFKPEGTVSSKKEDDGKIDERALFPKQQKESRKETQKETKKESRKELKKESRKENKVEKRHKKVEEEEVIAQETVPETLPESPLQMEEAEVVTKEYSEEFHFSTTRMIYRQNGVPFVYSKDGESYASIAEDNNLFLREILKFNDLPFDQKLNPGTMVYLQAKKNQTRKGLDKYIVEQDGESLRDICQRFGVKQKNIMKINAFDPEHKLRGGDTILLRK